MIGADCWLTTARQPRVIGYWQKKVYSSIDSISYDLDQSSSNGLNHSSTTSSYKHCSNTTTDDPIDRKLNCLELSTRSTIASSEEGGSDNNTSYVDISSLGDTTPSDVGQDEDTNSRVFVYPTWSLLGRNHCYDTTCDYVSGQNCNVGKSSGARLRSQSNPPPLKNAKIAQRSSHTKMMVAARRCRSIGRSKGIVPGNHLRPRHIRGDDFRSLENVNIPALQAMSSTDEKTACNALFRQDTRRLGLRGAHVNRCHRSPMDHPYFIWTLLTGNQSTISRIKLLHLLSILQHDKKHECHQNCCLLQNQWRKSNNISYDTSSKLTLLQGGHTIIGLGKEQNEDAFSCPVTPGYTHSSGDTFVLADGVGEWRQYGLSSSAFAQRVVRASHDCLDRRLSMMSSVCDRENQDCNTMFDVLVNSLIDGYKATIHKSPIYGACTIIAGVLHDKDKLTVASLGDCQVMQLRRDVIRKMRMVIVKKSKITQHSFNTPKQLVNCPNELDYDRLCDEGKEGTVKHIKAMREQAKEIGFDITSDDPVMSSMTEFTLREGDLILCGSDGLFDNLYDDEISHLCSYAMSPFESKLLKKMWTPTATESVDGSTYDDGYQCGPHSNLDNAWLEGCLAHPNAMEPPKFIYDPMTKEKAYYTDPLNLAKSLVEAAAARGMDPAANVPFGRAARRAGYHDMTIGGKADDTTCIAMWVTPEQTSTTTTS